MFVLKKVPDYNDLIENAAYFGLSGIDSIYTMLHVISVGGKIRASAEHFFARYNLSAGRFMILSQVALNRAEGLHPSKLAEKTGVSRATITGLIERLENDGFIKRVHSSKDRRGVALYLTQSGQELLEKILPIRAKQVACLMSSLEEDEKKTLVRLLLKIENNIEESEKIVNEPDHV